MQLALIRSSRKQWIAGLADAMNNIVRERADVARLSDHDLSLLFDRFTFRGPASRRRANEPCLFWALSEKTVLFDFFATERFIHDVFASTQAIEIRPSVGTPRRGPFFEEQVRLFFARELQLDVSRIVVDVTTGGRQIDLAFVANRVLFVIECKSCMKDGADLAGDHNKVRNRLEKFEGELAELVPQRIAAIRAGLVSNTIAPSDFVSAVGLVCTATVEYLPKSKSVFWSGGLPLVGSPEELLSTIRRLAETTQPVSDRSQRKTS
jgi:hypothetical protein